MELFLCQFTMQHSPQLMKSLFQGFALHQQRLFFSPPPPKTSTKYLLLLFRLFNCWKRDDDAHDKSVTISFSRCCSSSFLFCEGVSESGRRLQQQQQNMDLELKKHSRAQLNWINSLTLFETHNMKM